jgi:hypothetical protein
MKGSKILNKWIDRECWSMTMIKNVDHGWGSMMLINNDDHWPMMLKNNYDQECLSRRLIMDVDQGCWSRMLIKYVDKEILSRMLITDDDVGCWSTQYVYLTVSTTLCFLLGLYSLCLSKGLFGFQRVSPIFIVSLWPTFVFSTKFQL